jgi:hypothetical protein
VVSVLTCHLLDTAHRPGEQRVFDIGEQDANGSGAVCP